MYPLTPFLPSQSVNVLSSARMRRCSASEVWAEASPPRTRRDPGIDSAAAPSAAPRTNRRRDILVSNRLSATLAFPFYVGCVSIRSRLWGASTDHLLPILTPRVRGGRSKVLEEPRSSIPSVRCSTLPVPAAPWCLDRHHVSLFELPARFGRQLFAVQEVLADRSGLPAFDALRGVAPPVGEEGEACGLEHAHGADDAVAAPMLALSAGAVDELVALGAHGVLQLEGFDRGVQGVAHPDVDARRTGAFLTCSLAAADGLIVGPARAADDRVVHRPLALRRERG